MLIVWGGLVLYTFINGVRFLFDFGLIPQLSFIQLFKKYHLILLLPTLTILGGLFLLFSKKIGWTISLIALLLNALLFFIPAENGKSMLTEQKMALAIFSLAILSLTTFYILTLPVYRNKYRASKKTWLAIALTTFMILIDKTILYLTS